MKEIDPMVAGRLHVLDNNLAKVTLTVVTDQQTPLLNLRTAVDQLAKMLVPFVFGKMRIRPTRVHTRYKHPCDGHAKAETPFGILFLRTGIVFKSAWEFFLPTSLDEMIQIEKDNPTGKPTIISVKLPPSTEGLHLVFWDAECETGGTFEMALRIVREAGYPIDRITFGCFVIARETAIRLLTEYPALEIFTLRLDALGPDGHCNPGLGYLGDRLFGTRPEDSSGDYGRVDPRPSSQRLKKGGDKP